VSISKWVVVGSVDRIDLGMTLSVGNMSALSETVWPSAVALMGRMHFPPASASTRFELRNRL